MRWGPGLRGSRGPREGDLCKDGCRAMGECLKTRAGEVLGQGGLATSGPQGEGPQHTDRWSDVFVEGPSVREAPTEDAESRDHSLPCGK